MCRKAARQVNVLRRIGRHLPLSCRKIIYQSFVKSNFNFCPIIWNFCCELNRKKLEKLNLRALRQVYQDYESDYESLLTRDESESLQLQRQRLIAETVFKIFSRDCPSYLHSLISLKENSHRLRNQNAKLPSFKTVKYGKNAFNYFGAKLWNELPSCIRKVENFGHFRRLISSWTGVKCKCAACRSNGT